MARRSKCVTHLELLRPMSSCDLVTEFWQFSPVITKIKRPPKRGQAPNKCGPATNFKTAKALAQTSVTGQSLIGAQQKRFRNLDAGYVGGFEVDEQFELGWLLDRQVARLCALQYPVYVSGGATIQVSASLGPYLTKPPSSTNPGKKYTAGSRLLLARSTIRFL